ncbi:unnamed protein product [Polarella glacialis]|uniref:Protein xylosyltransferase n=1 Tax=Polarella glacialis TaxID=89957 RepID=A0A813J4G1_POLGL|nr:unnamed protein product [Polarella glacialis]CAE8662405.1 unnamed protein product [Polarella glacialis]
MSPTIRRRGAVLLISFCLSASTAREIVEDIPLERFEDDHLPALQRLRGRLESSLLNQSRGILMVSEQTDSVWSDLSIPIWEEYARQHDQGFFLQREPLLAGQAFSGWTTLRTLIELMPKVQWKYMLVVTSNALPAKFNETWDDLITSHMRAKRYANDSPEKRVLWFPWDCEDDSVSAFTRGTCYGPFFDIFIVQQKPKASKIISSWFVKRKVRKHEDSYAKAFQATAPPYGDYIFYRKAATAEIGLPTSSRFPVWKFEANRQPRQVRDQMFAFMQKHPMLGPVGNLKQRQLESEL